MTNPFQAWQSAWAETFRYIDAQSASRPQESEVSSGTLTPDAIRRMADRLRHHRCEPGLLELHEEAAKMLEELASELGRRPLREDENDADLL